MLRDIIVPLDLQAPTKFLVQIDITASSMGRPLYTSVLSVLLVVIVLKPHMNLMSAPKGIIVQQVLLFPNLVLQVHLVIQLVSKVVKNALYAHLVNFVIALD